MRSDDIIGIITFLVLIAIFIFLFMDSDDDNSKEMRTMIIIAVVFLVMGVYLTVGLAISKKKERINNSTIIHKENQKNVKFNSNILNEPNNLLTNF